jgi:hypothetical protein
VISLFFSVSSVNSWATIFAEAYVSVSMKGSAFSNVLPSPGLIFACVSPKAPFPWLETAAILVVAVLIPLIAVSNVGAIRIDANNYPAAKAVSSER